MGHQVGMADQLAERLPLSVIQGGEKITWSISRGAVRATVTGLPWHLRLTP
jgi:hypothetical protein